MACYGRFFDILQNPKTKEAIANNFIHNFEFDNYFLSFFTYNCPRFTLTQCMLCYIKCVGYVNIFSVSTETNTKRTIFLHLKMYIVNLHET